MLDPDAAVKLKDIVGWICTGIGIAISLGWNLLNRRHTDAIAQQVRGENFDFEEWKALRLGIEAKLQTFQERIDTIVALSLGAHNSDALRKELSVLGLALTTAHEALIFQLMRRDQGWVTLAFGKVVHGESDWDKINTVLADIATSTNDADVLRTRLLALKPLVASIRGVVDEHVRAETIRHHPVKL